MSHPVTILFAVLLALLIILFGFSGILYSRRVWLAREQQRHSVHVRLLRAELMQALARDENAFLIEHWTGRDRKAALEVAAQLLAFLKGRDREKLEAIVETNNVLTRTLLRINRISKSRRIAAIRSLAAFGNSSVQGTLEHLMVNDPSTEVRLEAAIAITVAGELPTPWHVIRSICSGVATPSPNHFRLFEAMMPEKCEAMIALATMQDDPAIRTLAAHALGYADSERPVSTLRSLVADEVEAVAKKAAASLERLELVLPKARPLKKASVIYLADKRAA